MESNKIHENVVVPSAPVDTSPTNEMKQPKPMLSSISTADNLTPQNTSNNEQLPVSKAIKRIFYDPSTSKILSILISTYAVFCLYHRNSSATFIVINIASLIYAAFSLLVTAVWMNQDKIGNSIILKKAFCGRKVHWHEIHGTISFVLAFAHFSTLIFIFNSFPYTLATIITLTNTYIFFTNWLSSAKKGNLYLNEEIEPKCCCKCSKCFLSAFKRFPAIFNFLRLAGIISAIVMCAVFVSPSIYFYYCTIICVAASLVLMLTRFSKRILNRLSSKLLPKHKFHTCMSLLITLHAFLIVLFNGFYTQTYYEFYNYGNNGYFGRYENYRNYGGYYNWQHFVTRYPISYGLSCIVLLLSLMDLYSQAIFHRTQAPEETYQPLSSVETTEKKQQNLPMIIENPFFIENEKNQNM